jgi:hypothetical protein
MRLLFGGLCTLAAIAIAGDADAAPAQAGPPACLGGVLNERPTGDYLTVADYPAFAALTAELRRFLICGDSIPAFLPSGQRAATNSRHR